MQHSLLVSIVFYIFGFIYVTLGTYAVETNAKSYVNRLFVSLTSSMGAWSFALSLATSAATAEESAFWRCLSVFGWGVYYSIFLHFVLILTRLERKLNNGIMLFAIYLPALINIILFAPFGILAESQYQLVKSDFGWVNVLPSNAGRLWLIAYYIIFSLISIVLLVYWWAKLKPGDPQKRHAGDFILSILTASLLGLLTDTVPDLIGIGSLPKLAIIFLMLPVTVLSLTLKKSGLLLERKRELPSFLQTEQRTNEDRGRVFRTVSSIYTAGSAVAFFVGYFTMEKTPREALPLTALLLALGIFVRVMPHLTKNHTVQNNLFLATGIISLVYIMARNAATGAATIWAVYVVFFVFTVILDSNLHLVIYGIVAIAIQIVFAIIRSELLFTIDIGEYMTRIAIIVLTIFAVRRLASEYALKLNIHKKFIKEQKVIEAISTNFISVSGENIRRKVEEMLEMASGVLGFDYAYLIGFSEDYEDAIIFCTHAKDSASKPLPYYPGMKLKFDSLPVASILVDRGAPIICEGITNTPLEECEQTRNYLVLRDVNSFFAYPLQLEGQRIEGMLVFEYYDRSSESLKENRSYFLNIIVNMLGDARKKIQYEEMLYNFAYFDESTNLANKHMMTKRLEEHLKDRKESQKLAVLNIEIDNLRMIKDTFGQGVAEQVMVNAARILENRLHDRSHDISRTNEGEFTVVLGDLESREDVEHCVEKLLDTFSHPISTSDRGTGRLFIILRIGIALYPNNGPDAKTLLRNADLAGFEAMTKKEDFVFYEERMGSNIEENTLYTNRLFESLQNKEFFLEFQPQINCKTGEIAGVEALLRWTSDGSNRVPPLRFIPILEQTGLIYDVGLWVLEETLKEHKRLIKKGFAPLRFSVNLSLVQFEEENLVPDIKKIIEESEVDPKYIELEITESFFAKNPEEAVKKLYALKALGSGISIDDFGKGYSSLNRLKLVPFDRIKIDKELIDYIDVENKYAPLTQMIISLAESFRASVTAEGVETMGQADFLKSVHCDEIQGFYYSKPLSPEALEEFLLKTTA